jgi:Zn-dependent protease
MLRGMPSNFGSFRLFTLRGIEVRVHWSWTIIFLVLSWTLADSGFFGAYRDWPVIARWVLGVTTMLLFFCSVVGHELAHSLMAQHYGMRVPSITLFAFGGVSMIATEMRTAGQEFVVAIVGPLSSWAMAAVCGLLWLVLGDSPARLVLGYIGGTNAVLGLFNLLPGFPLDGGRVLRAAIWARSKDVVRATRIAANGGRVVGYGLMVLGVFALWQRDTIGLWYILIGMFLRSAAGQSYGDVMSEVLLRDVPARQLMAAPPDPVEWSTTLLDLLDTRVTSSTDHVFLVRRNDAITGLLTVTDIVRVPRDDWSRTHAQDVMVPAEKVITIAPSTSIVDAMRMMQEHSIHQLPVLEDGRLLGIVTLAEVVRQAEIRMRGGNGRPPRPL